MAPCLSAVCRSQGIHDFVDVLRCRFVSGQVVKATNRDNERKCCEIRIRAERRTGELYRDQEKAKGAAYNGNRGKGKVARSQPTTTQKLSDLGISKDQSSDWQKLATISAAASGRGNLPA